ncbi:uncharacterized protein LOC111264436 [Varroa jacobsoni]|uniref:uncharacterized protein LOC111264436 n=1 Tax=Varroa jacobsoni TaxID=62625 RepID=UPI000BF58D3E|nr:uncharacterized protein LOC111264436 [Varroa jacobsoni]
MSSPAADAANSPSHGHIEAEFAHALGNLRAFLDGQLAFQPQPPPIPLSSTTAMLASQPLIGGSTTFQRAHIQTLRSLEQWSTVLNDYLNLLDGCCASHPMLRQRVAAITRRLLRLQLSGNLPQPSASSYPIPMAGLTALHSHQIGRNLQCITPFNSKQNVHLGAGSCPSGPCASNGPGMRSPDQHLVGTPSCSGILLPKVVDHRVHGNI